MWLQTASFCSAPERASTCTSASHMSDGDIGCIQAHSEVRGRTPLLTKMTVPRFDRLEGDNYAFAWLSALLEGCTQTACLNIASWLGHVVALTGARSPASMNGRRLMGHKLPFTKWTQGALCKMIAAVPSYIGNFFPARLMPKTLTLPSAA